MNDRPWAGELYNLRDFSLLRPPTMPVARLLTDKHTLGTCGVQLPAYGHTELPTFASTLFGRQGGCELGYCLGNTSGRNYRRRC